MVLRLYKGLNLNNKENHLRNESHTHFLRIIATQPNMATIKLFLTINIVESFLKKNTRLKEAPVGQKGQFT